MTGLVVHFSLFVKIKRLSQLCLNLGRFFHCSHLLFKSFFFNVFFDGICFSLFSFRSKLNSQPTMPDHGPFFSFLSLLLPFIIQKFCNVVFDGSCFFTSLFSLNFLKTHTKLPESWSFFHFSRLLFKSLFQKFFCRH